MIPSVHTQTNPTPRLAYPIDEAATLLGVSRWSVYKLIREGKLQPVRIGARQRIPAEELARMTQPQVSAA